MAMWRTGLGYKSGELFLSLAILVGVAVSIACPSHASGTADCLVGQVSKATQDEIAARYASSGVNGLQSWVPNQAELSRITVNCGLVQIQPQLVIVILRAGAIKNLTAGSLEQSYNVRRDNLSNAWNNLSAQERYSFRTSVIDKISSGKPMDMNVIIVLNHIIAILGAKPISESDDFQHRPGLLLLVSYYANTAIIEWAESKLGYSY